ncbi:hypothetical protein NEDG_00328 [Nematocida displodere]|uniref:Kri1-like C-terminal domain-containing protein n=1 Tax=Nematocida displodere TaxID=1805483 RepID=A0A177EIR3_9MICR|nr:hypothetical protein NEDG_00328 [Nematocida displodere]
MTSNEEAGSENPFAIDSRMEKKYNARKASEEIKELEEKYQGEWLSETESEECDYQDDPAENRAIKALLEKIRSRDPEIYTSQVYFTAPESKAAKSDQSYRLKDFYRDQVLEQMNKTDKLKQKLEYDQEQNENIEAFITALNEEEPQGSLFTKKATLPEEEEAEQADFLQRYLLEGGWQQAVAKEESLKDFLDEDSEELELIEEFDREGLPAINTNFATAKKPAQIRKRKELRKKIRQDTQAQIKQEELRRLKNLKKQQFAERLALLKKVSGLSNRKLAKINLMDAYSEASFDKLIETLFDDKYFDREETKRPKVKGSSVEAQELQEMDALAEKGEVQSDRKRVKDVKKILTEMKSLGQEYSALGNKGDFEYVQVPTVSLNLSVKDIFSMDDKELKRKYPLKKYAPFQDDAEKRKMTDSLNKHRS